MGEPEYQEQDLELMLSVFSDRSIESGFVAATYALNRPNFLPPAIAIPMLLDQWREMPQTTKETFLRCISGETATVTKKVEKIIHTLREEGIAWKTKAGQVEKLLSQVNATDLTDFDLAYLQDARSMITTEKALQTEELQPVRITIEQTLETLLQQKPLLISPDAKPESRLAYALRTIPKVRKNKFQVITEAYDSLRPDELLRVDVLNVGKQIVSGGSWINRIPKIEEAIQDVDPDTIGLHERNYILFALRYLESNQNLNSDSLKRQWAAPIKDLLRQFLGEEYAQYHTKAEELRDIRQLLKELATEPDIDIAAQQAEDLYEKYELLKPAVLAQAPEGERYDLSKLCEIISRSYQSIKYKPISQRLRDIQTHLKKLSAEEDPVSTADKAQYVIEHYRRIKEEALDEVPDDQLAWAENMCSAIEELDNLIFERERQYTLDKIIDDEQLDSTVPELYPERTTETNKPTVLSSISKIFKKLTVQARAFTLPVTLSAFLIAAIASTGPETAKTHTETASQQGPQQASIYSQPLPPPPKLHALSEDEKEDFCKKRLMLGSKESQLQVINPSEIGDLVENCFTDEARARDSRVASREKAARLLATTDLLKTKPVSIRTIGDSTFFSPYIGDDIEIPAGGTFGVDRVAKRIPRSKYEKMSKTKQEEACLRKTQRDGSKAYYRKKTDSDGNIMCVRSHEGIDLKKRQSREQQVKLYSVMPGRVAYIGKNHPSAGTYVDVDHGNGLVTRYLHLAFISDHLEEDFQRKLAEDPKKMRNFSRGHYTVVAFSPQESPAALPHILRHYVDGPIEIGTEGQTGNAKGPHLHFEIRKNGRAVNPAHYLPLPSNIQKLIRFAEEHDHILEDIAQKLNIRIDVLRRIRAQESETMTKSPIEDAYGFFQVKEAATRQAMKTCLSIDDLWDHGNGLCNELNFNTMKTKPEINLWTGALYMKYLVQRYDGDYTKAVAAYNFGEGKLSKIIKRAEENNWNWIDLLPTKVKKYVTTALDDRPASIESLEIYIPFEGTEINR